MVTATAHQNLVQTRTKNFNSVTKSIQLCLNFEFIIIYLFVSGIISGEQRNKRYKE